MKKFDPFFNWLIKNKKLLLIFLAVIYAVILILHIIFYSAEDKLSQCSITALAPFLGYAGFKIMFSFIKAKSTENDMNKIILFFLLGAIFIFVTYSIKYIINFPNGLSVALTLIMGCFLELISEIKNKQ